MSIATVGTVGYGLAAIMFLAAWCALPASSSARQWRHRMRFAWATGLLWGTALAVQASGLTRSWPFDSAHLMPLLDIARYGAALVGMAALVPTPPAAGVRRLNLLVLGAALLLAVAGNTFLEPAHVISRVGLLLAFVGLVNVEQMLRNAPAHAARAIKFCVIGLGGQFAYDLFLYSQSELLGGPDQESWSLRGYVFAALLPFAIISCKRLADERPNVFVSRQVVFYSTAFVGVGVYLLVMALGGYYVRQQGGSWGESLRLLFFVGAAVVLAMLMFAQSPWRRLKVFLAKHFYRNKYDYRIEWLRFISTLSSTEESGGDVRVTALRAVAQILESPAGVLYLRSEGSPQFDAVASWSSGRPLTILFPAVDARHELAHFLAEREWVVDIAEYRAAPNLYRNITLPDWLQDPQGNWRIINPLLGSTQLLGFMVLQEPPAPYQTTFEDRDLLRTVGRHVTTLLAQHAADRKLAEARQFDAFNRFAAFVMHDLKNAAAQLQLVVSNAAIHRHNPQFVDDAIETVGNTAARMTRLIEQLQTRDAQDSLRPVRLAPLLQAIAARANARQPAVSLQAPTAACSVTADADRLGAVIDHVVRNAQEATGAGGSVNLTMQQQDGHAQICIVDDGPGMSPEFVREQLFRPFESTKGSKGMGIGAYQAREYVLQLGGQVEVQSSPASGTRFLIKLPLCQTPDPES